MSFGQPKWVGEDAQAEYDRLVLALESAKFARRDAQAQIERMQEECLQAIDGAQAALKRFEAVHVGEFVRHPVVLRAPVFLARESERVEEGS